MGRGVASRYDPEPLINLAMVLTVFESPRDVVPSRFTFIAGRLAPPTRRLFGLCTSCSGTFSQNFNDSSVMFVCVPVQIKRHDESKHSFIPLGLFHW